MKNKEIYETSLKIAQTNGKLMHLFYSVEKDEIHVAYVENPFEYVKRIHRGPVTYLCRKGRVVGYKFNSLSAFVNFKEIKPSRKLPLLLRMWRHKKGFTALNIAKKLNLHLTDYVDTYESIDTELILQDLDLLKKGLPEFPLHLVFK